MFKFIPIYNFLISLIDLYFFACLSRAFNFSPEKFMWKLQNVTLYAGLGKK